MIRWSLIGSLFLGLSAWAGPSRPLPQGATMGQNLRFAYPNRCPKPTGGS